jgi:selenide,water dikinase
MNQISDHNLLSSFENNEDAAVYRINSYTAIIFTTDFITPVVNDPFTFGQIAAANALSDVFAMGGRPLMALNIVCFPENRLEELEKIVSGGLQKVKEAGAILVGGHSLKDSEPKYGLAVVGLVHPDKVICNNNCQEGDRIILTKPLGTGIISTALKSEYLSENEAQEAIGWMSKLNAVSDDILNLAINSMTDITGYGFLGHLSEMVQGSDVGADIEVDKIPLLANTVGLAQEGVIPGGSFANQEIFSCGVEKKIELEPAKEITLYDAQTSGGLLISIAQRDVEQALDLLHKEGFTESSVIGKIRKININERRISLI